MINSRKCPKCGQANIIRIPDNPNRYSSGNNIYTTKVVVNGAA